MTERTLQKNCGNRKFYINKRVFQKNLMEPDNQQKKNLRRTIYRKRKAQQNLRTTVARKKSKHLNKKNKKDLEKQINNLEKEKPILKELEQRLLQEIENFQFHSKMKDVSYYKKRRKS